MTAPCEIAVVPEPAGLFRHDREPVDYYPYTWLRMSLTEGRFHQVRKMVAGLGHRCIRLIRVSIEDLVVDGLEAGEVREVEEKMFFERLKIANWQSDGRQSDGRPIQRGADGPMGRSTDGPAGI